MLPSFPALPMRLLSLVMIPAFVPHAFVVLVWFLFYYNCLKYMSSSLSSWIDYWGHCMWSVLCGNCVRCALWYNWCDWCDVSILITASLRWLFLEPFVNITSCLFCCWVFVTKFPSGNYKCWLSQSSLLPRLLLLKCNALMHIKVFNTAQACYIAQAIYEYWHNSCAMFQTRSLQVLGQFHASQTEGFHKYIAELVCDCLLCVFPMLIIPQ